MSRLHAGGALCLLVLACSNDTSATGGAQASSGDTGPRILTESLAQAVAGQAYRQELAAAGGQAPYLWSVSSRDPGLEWLQIEPRSGVLSGIPEASLTEGASLTISVTDQRAASGQRAFLLAVRACSPDAPPACSIAADGICSIGQAACVDGAVTSSCDSLQPSSDKSLCGPSCSECGPSADSCTGGVGAAPAAGERPAPASPAPAAAAPAPT
jgi:hypothetical protein